MNTGGFIYQAGRVLLTLALVTCFLPAHPQSQNYIDLVRMEYLISPVNDFQNGSGTTNLESWVLDITAPVPLGEKTVLLTGLLFEQKNLRLFPEEPEIAVRTVNVKLGLNRTFSPDWSASLLLLPKASSDLKAIKGDDIQCGAAALATYSKSPSLRFKFGAFYNADLFGPLFSPLFGLYLQQRKWELNILLPRLVDVNYGLSQKIKVGLRFDGAIRSYNLNGTVRGVSQYLYESNNDLGTYVNGTFGRINIRAMVGHSVGRLYRTYENGDRMDLAISVIKIGDDRKQLNTDFQDGVFFKLSMLYRLDLP
ncbi:MAG: hypothetical protein EP344_09010 [Bacteroidetes bacterium]|nr:MAG: hypothetical protein EP344_09010 [Bacteroidota bacterium]